MLVHGYQARSHAYFSCRMAGIAASNEELFTGKIGGAGFFTGRLLAVHFFDATDLLAHRAAREPDHRGQSSEHHEAIALHIHRRIGKACRDLLDKALVNQSVSPCSYVSPVKNS